MQHLFFNNAQQIFVTLRLKSCLDTIIIQVQFINPLTQTNMHVTPNVRLLLLGCWLEQPPYKVFKWSISLDVLAALQEFVPSFVSPSEGS
jgi:hypothetical protein